MIGDEVDSHVKVAARQRVKEQLGFKLPVLGFDAELAPLIDGVDAGSRIGLTHVAIEEDDLEVTDPGLFQQTSCVLTRLVDVAAVTWQRFEFGRGEGMLVASARAPARIYHERTLGHAGRETTPRDRPTAER